MAARIPDREQRPEHSRFGSAGHVGRRLVLAAVLVGNLFYLATPSLSLDSAVASQIDKEFSHAVAKVAALRETNRSTAVDVKALFEPIVQRHSLQEFHDYIGSHYKLKRVKDAYDIGEYTEIDESDLKRMDGRFLYLDTLRVGFIYDQSGTVIDHLYAILLNGQL